MSDDGPQFSIGVPPSVTMSGPKSVVLRKKQVCTFRISVLHNELAISSQKRSFVPHNEAATFNALSLTNSLDSSDDRNFEDGAWLCAGQYSTSEYTQ
jgi:hypothetical protein